MREHAVCFENYSFMYENAEKAVLSDVSMCLDYGEVVLLSGPSGSGKSTLLYCINGVIPYSVPGEISGTMTVDGRNVDDIKTAQRSFFVGSVLQNAEAQIVHEIVEDEIAFPCENLRMAPEEISKRISHVCALMKLDPADETMSLSGGQKQRLITAATLAMGQKILLLDEPLANLDIAGAAQLMETLRKLAHEQDYAVLIVEHRLDMVLPYADRVFVLSDGRISETDREGLTGRKEEACPVEHAPCGDAVITAQNLSYSVKGKEILKDISFSAAEGERIVVLGENGCGKTTLLRLLAGLLKPSAGSVGSPLLSGTKIGSPAWFRKVGVVEQNPDYQLFMPSVDEEIGFGAVSGEWKEEILKDFALDSVRDQHPQSLSEGQKRKCSLGAILAMRPKLLLLDEPTVGQDADSLDNMIRILDELQKSLNMTQLIVTHERNFAREHSDRIIWIRDGSVYMDGGREVCDAYFGYMRSSG